jgi:predicted lipoprotein
MFRSITLCFAGGALLGLSVMGGHPGPQGGMPKEQAVATAFVDEVVLPSYRQLDERTRELSRALERLADAPSEAHLEAARTAWRAARQSWETTESWAFGPAGTEGFDGNLDDWPVNEKDLGTALVGGSLSPAIFAKLTSTARGFHGVEFVLFGRGPVPPQVGQLTSAQRSYLRLAGADLVANTGGLLAAWQGPSGYGASFSGAGEGGSAAIAEILQGMVGTLQEVADEKLGAPLQSRDPAGLESRYSGATQADVVANLEGIQQGWRRSGLQQLLASRDGALADRIEAELAATLQQAKQLPPQLNDRLKDGPTRAAIDAVIASTRRTADLLEQASGRLG